MFGAERTYNLYIETEEEEDAYLSELPPCIMPAFQVPHPWNRLGVSRQPDIDFILVAEFSELEGPRPVITIPSAGVNDFNITDFAVRIMSLDHQTTTSHGFHLSEDSQVLISETRDNVFAFVHYLSLYDRHARGFIRPFAISYVTPDHRKLMYFYEEISSKMKKVARFLKYGNKLMFKNELETYLLDLHYTKAQMLLQHRSKSHPSSEVTDDRMFKNLKSLESLQAETENILRTIKPTLTDKRMEQRFCRMEERARIDQKRPKADSFSLQEWDEVDVCSLHHVSGSVGDTADIESTLFPDNRNYKPKVVKITTGRKFDLHLRGIHELCSWGAKEGLQRLRHLYQFFKRDMSVLQSEHMDRSLNEPASGLLTFGNDLLASNFMSNIDKNCVSCCLRRQGQNTEYFLGRWPSVDTLESFKSLESSFKSALDTESLVANSSLSSTPDGSYEKKVKNNSADDEYRFSVNLTSDELTRRNRHILDDQFLEELYSRHSSAQNSPSSSFRHKTDISNPDQNSQNGMYNMDSRGVSVTEDSGRKNDEGSSVDGIGSSVDGITICDKCHALEVEDDTKVCAKCDENRVVNGDIEDLGLSFKEGNSSLCKDATNIPIQKLSVHLKEVPIQVMDRGEDIVTVDNHMDGDNLTHSDSAGENLTHSDSAGDDVTLNHSLCDNPTPDIHIDQKGATNQNVADGVSESCAKDFEGCVEEPSVGVDGDIKLGDGQKSCQKGEGNFSEDPKEVFDDGQKTRDNTKILLQNEEIKDVDRKKHSESNENMLIESIPSVSVNEHDRNKAVPEGENLEGQRKISTNNVDIQKEDDPSKMYSALSQSLKEVMYEQIAKESEKSQLQTNTEDTDRSLTPSASGSELFPHKDSADEMSSGFGLLKTMNTYPPLIHVIYSILIGRTVLVIGTPGCEEEVKDIVKALTVFIPSLNRTPECCVPWTCKLPRITELSRVRLLGVCRPERKSLDRFVPKALKRLVSILDVDKKTIYSIPYQGYYLSLISSKRKSFHIEETFLALVKSLLMEMMSKAFIYFHTFSLGSIGTKVSGHSLHNQSYHVRQNSSNFLGKLGIFHSDVQIIEHLSEIIKLQHISDYFSSFGLQGMPSQPLSLCHPHSVQIYRC